MRHLNTGRKLNRSGAHRKALLRNLATALIVHEKIRTTDAKAKELRGFADRLVTLGKEATLHAKRRAFDRIRDEGAVKKLFEEIAARFKDRNGGYTRVTKLGMRHGDAAPVSVIEWTTEPEKAKKKTKGRRKAADKHDHDHAGHKHEAPKKRAAAG
jgi:large subunit ribosomal protein L17